MPIKLYSNVEFALPIFGKLVLLSQASDEMIDVFFPRILYPEVIYHQRKLNWACHMTPQARRVGTLVVPEGFEVLSQRLIGQNARLW